MNGMVILVVLFSTAVLLILLGAVYDTRLALKKSRAKSTRMRHISVIVWVDGPIDSLRKCLDALRSSKWGSLDITVLGSNRYGMSREYKSTLQGAERYYVPRKKMSHQQRILAAYKRSQGGDAIVISSNILVTPKTLSQAAATINANPRNNNYYFIASSNEAVSFSALSDVLKGLANRLQARVNSLVGRPTKMLYHHSAYGYIVSKYAMKHELRDGAYYESLVSPQFIITNEVHRATIIKRAISIIYRSAFLSLASLIFISISSGEWREPLLLAWVFLSILICFYTLTDQAVTLTQKFTVLLSVGILPIFVLLAYVTAPPRFTRET